MLREVTSASNDGACLEHCEAETASHRHDLGAHLDGASTARRDAAVMRSRRMPSASTVGAAWRNLPAHIRDQFGEAGLIHHFYNVVCQDAVREVTLDAGHRGAAAADLASERMDRLAVAALPELYGTAEAEPSWVMSDTPLSFPAPTAPSAAATRMPPKVRAEAIARSRRVPGLDAIIEAWSRLPPATQDLLGVQAVAVAFYGHLTDDGLREPAERHLTDTAVGRCQCRTDKALNLLGDIASRSLPELYGTRKKDPAWAQLDADPAALGALWEAALPSPVQCVIALHRACWRALQASAESLKARGEWEERSKLSWPAEEAEDEALTDCLMTSCRDRADAEAMGSHLSWYLQTFPQHPKQSAMGKADAALIAVRLRDLSMILGRQLEGVASAAVPGAMAGLIAEHRAAWSTYRVSPDAVAWGSVQRVTLQEGLDEAAEAVLLAPCVDRAEAAAFVEHVGWLSAELKAAGDDLAGGSRYEAKQMQARAGDLAVWLAKGHRLQG